MRQDKIISLYDKYVMNTYKRVPLCLNRGRGSYVWDADGKKYIDFFPGWAVSGIGHCHPMVSKAVAAMSKKIMHVSNNYYAEPQALLAKSIIDASFRGKVFFSNSGAEANEAAVKLARKYGHLSGRYEIITMEKSFHGRTLGMIAATGQDKVKIGFEPMVPGFKYARFNDIDSVKSAITEKTIGIMLEPIQCEGGINIPDVRYLKELRKLCDARDLILIFDEVQTGMGRSGKMFACQVFGITPDVMTLAKSLGGGLPIGACVASEKFQDVLTPGAHASTFGGSPIVCAAALAVFEAIKKDKLLANTVRMSAYLRKKLEALKLRCGIIKEIRSVGLIVGVELTVKGDDIYKECMKKGLLINCTQDTVLRIMPPMTVSRSEIDCAVGILSEVLAAY